MLFGDLNGQRILLAVGLRNCLQGNIYLTPNFGVHLSNISCYYSFNDSFTFSHICIQNRGVSRQWCKTLLSCSFLSQHNRVQHSQIEDGLQHTDGIRLLANTGRHISQATSHVLSIKVPVESLASTLT